MTSHWPHLPALSRLLAPYVVAGASAVSRCHDALGCDRSQESRGGTGEPREVVPHASYRAPPASPTAHRDRTPTHPRPLPARSSQASKLAMMPFRHVRARRCAAATHHAPRACLFLTASPVLCRRREQPSAEPERIGTGGALDAGAPLCAHRNREHIRPPIFCGASRAATGCAERIYKRTVSACVSVLLAC